MNLLLLKSFFGQLPRGVWIALAAALAFAFAYRSHEAAKKRVYDEGYAAGVLANEAGHIKAQTAADERARAINADQRKQNDEDNRRIADAADDVRLRGPGRAVCPGAAPAPRPASGHVAPGGTGDAAVAEVPAAERVDLIALPFPDTVAFAQQCDANRAEVLRWREADRLQSVQP